MTVNAKLNILSALFVLFIFISILIAYEIRNGSYLHVLNFNHIKYNYKFETNLKHYEAGLTHHLDMLEEDINWVKQQPLDCLKEIDTVEFIFMKIINTDKAHDLCVKDIKDADQALNALANYKSGTLDQSLFLKAMHHAVEEFNENSRQFDPLVKRTVEYLFLTLFILGGCIAVIFLIAFKLITSAIKKDYNHLEYLSSEVKKLASFPENNPQPIIEITKGLEVTYKNDAFKQQICSKSSTRDITSIFSPSIINKIGTAFISKTPVTFEDKIQDTWYDGFISPVDLNNQEWVRIFLHDISAQKQAHAELEEFSYRTSHDLRSPLISSLSLLDLAIESINENKTKDALQSLEHVQNSLNKLETLVNDILSLAQTKHASEKAQSINITSIVEDALNKFSHMQNFTKINIQTELNFTQTITLQKSQITLIIENLISNAIKYYDPGKKSPFIKISTFEEGEHFVFEVLDNGLGIPTKYQGQLFTMFKRYHPKTSFGSGLGLYMVKKSADILNGNIIHCGSQDGTVFRFTVPLTQKA